MVTTIRAAISVALLAGFYLLAVGLIAGFGGVALWAWQEHPGAAAGKLSYVAVALAIGLVVAMWRVLRARPEQPSGLVVRPDQSPVLWATVRELARAVGTREPDEIRLIPEVNAAVTEDAKLLGLVPGPRYLYLGVPLLQALTVAQLRSVLSHELGHYSHSHTRLGALSYRGRMTIIRTIEQIGPRSVVGFIFRMYAGLYFLAEQAVSRRQEYEADQASVRIAGSAVAASALRELPVVDAAWSFYVDRYVAWGWEAGYAPDDLFGGFWQLLQARRAELERLRAQTPKSETSKWDSHPPIPDRIAAIEATRGSYVPTDDRPAYVLVAYFDAACRALQAQAVDVGRRTVLSWNDFTAAAAMAVDQREADVLFRAAARIARRPSADLGTVLDLVAAGYAGELAQMVARQDPDALGGYVAAAIRLAAVGSGAAHWRHSWAGPAQLVDRFNAFLEVDDLARRALAPQTVGDARARLAARGVNVAAAVQMSASATAAGADVLGGLANVKVDGAPHDVYVLNNGLVLVPCQKDTDGGKDRMLTMLQSAPVTEIARYGRFLGYEEIASATIAKSVPVRAELRLHDGRTVKLQETWTGDTLGKDSRDQLLAALTPYASTGVGA